MHQQAISLTSGHTLARNTLLNLVARAFPLLAMLVAVPLLLNGLGIERFGVLSLAWMVLGSFTVFDLGLGRALTKFVAEKLGRGETKDLPQLVWTALVLLLLVGCMGGALFSVVSAPLVKDLLEVSEPLQGETIEAFQLLSLGVPLVIVQLGLRGTLEAQQRFATITAIQIPMSVFTLFGPVMVLPFSDSVVAPIEMLLAVRFISGLAYLIATLRVIPVFGCGVTFRRDLAGQLVRFGAWMSINNIALPIILTMDRFFIASLLSIELVTFYAVPYEIATKLWILPQAVLAVLFPAFSTACAADKERVQLLLRRGNKYIFLGVLPIALAVSAFAEEALALWVGRDFASQSYRILQLLCLGVLINALAYAPYALIQAMGRPDLTAKWLLIQIPLYVLGLWWFIDAYGILGAATCWVLRVAIDALGYHLIVMKVSTIRPFNFNNIGLAVCTVVLTFLPIIVLPLTPRTVFLIVVLALFACTTWFRLISPQEQRTFRRLFAKPS